MPKIGYGSNKKTRHMMPNGLKAVPVSNVKDVSVNHYTIINGRFCELEKQHSEIE